MVGIEQSEPEKGDSILAHGNVRLAEVALTFDDGPSPYTLPILQTLRNSGVRATFFCVGSQIPRYKAIARQAYDEGHQIENHTWSHLHLPALPSRTIEQELTRCTQVITEVVAAQPTFFRPPYGEYNGEIVACAYRHKMMTTTWDVDPQDWDLPGADAIIERVTTRTKSGSIILMHDSGGDRSQTVEALPRIIRLLMPHFRFVTLRELVAHLAGPDNLDQ